MHTRSIQYISNGHTSTHDITGYSGNKYHAASLSDMDGCIGIFRKFYTASLGQRDTCSRRASWISPHAHQFSEVEGGAIVKGLARRGGFIIPVGIKDGGMNLRSQPQAGWNSKVKFVNRSDAFFSLNNGNITQSIWKYCLLIKQRFHLFSAPA